MTCRAELCPYWPGEGCLRGVMPCNEDDGDDRDRCIHCGAEVDHYLGCPEDPDPDYEAEAEARGLTS